MLGRSHERIRSKLFKSGAKYAAIAGGAIIAGLIAVYALHSRCHRANYPQGGMWLPEQIPQHAEALKKLGLEIPPTSLAQPDQAPLSASVFLAGCSASFISPQGLIATNHHCVVGILNNLGKDGNDYQANGFLAKSMRDEKPAPPTQKAYVTLGYEDVTESIRDGLELIPDDVVRADTLDRRIDEVIRAREVIEKAKDPSIQVEVKGYYRDSRFILWLKKEIRDVRLVYAPHSGIGNFGGDVDNWHWPRHTGDFALLRAYVSKSGESTPYSPDNVPFESKSYLKLPSEPLKTGDLVFVMGYPGATERWETAEEVKKEIDVHYPHMIARSRGFIRALETFEKGENPQSARVAKGMLPRLRNYLPLWEGELDGMKKFGVLQEKEREQEKILAWVEQKPERQERFSTVSDSRNSAEKATETKDPKEADRLKDRSLREFITWGFSSRPPAGLFRAGLLITRMAEARLKKDEDRRADLKQREWENLRISIGQTYQDQIDIEVEKTVAAYFLELARQAGNEQLLEAVTGQKNPFEKDVRARLDEIYKKTKLLNLSARLALFDRATPSQLAASEDPALKIAQQIAEQWKKMEERADEERGQDLIEAAQWAEARSQYLGTPQAPDANASLRITFGTVCNYCPGFLRKPYPTFTYASEIVAKDKAKSPFDTPARALEAMKKRDFGRYADPTSGDLPVAFISDLDITGGNSGSPVLNRRGELVGLAFDGVVEAMASDKKFLPEFSRTIAVDTRYLLWTLDKVESANWLLEELGQPPTGQASRLSDE